MTSTLEEIESCLSKSPLFQEIPDDKLSDIARAAGYQVVRPHTVIFKEGDPGDSFYIINSGRVRVTKTGRGGVDILVAKLGPGDIFGQLSILTGDLRGVNVEAIEETSLTILSKENFDNILREYSNVSFAFAKQMSQYLAKNITVIKKKSEHYFRVGRSSWLDYIVIFAVSLLFGIIFNLTNPNGIDLMPPVQPVPGVTRMVPSLAMAKHAAGETLFVDARPSTLYEKMHIEGAVNIPLALFDIMYMMELSELNKDKPIVVYGRTISSHYDERVARKLILHGHKNVGILEGGLSGWRKSGYSVKSWEESKHKI